MFAPQSSFILSHVHRVSFIPSRSKYYHNRHRDQRYRVERGRKVWKVELPDFDYMRKEDKNTIDPDIVRSKLKEKGIAPPKPWNERELFNPCTAAVLKRYEPPEGDGKSSLLNKVKSPLTYGKDLIQHRLALNTIRGYEGEDFSLTDFAKESVDIYTKAHECLAARDDKTIFEYVTEYCFPLMTARLKRHTIIWKYLGEVEPPSVVQVQTSDQIMKHNKFAQITVRMHTKQIMAIYDRHGRLIYGSPSDVKEVLEYIVFEKYLSNEYGQWRVHDRIRSLKDQDAEPAKTRIIQTSQ